MNVSIIGMFLLAAVPMGQAAAEQRVPKGVSASDWAGIVNAHETAQRRMQQQEDGTYLTFNAGQQWRVSFDGKGFLTQPKVGGWKWGLELRGYGYAEKLRVPKKEVSATAEENRLVYQRDENLSEWYVNHKEGLQQGWTLRSRPQVKKVTGPLELILAVRGDLEAQLSKEGEVAFRDGKGARVLNYGGLKAWDADGKLLPVSFAVTNKGEVVVRVEDRDARYPVSIDPFAQQAYLKASNANVDDSFGGSVAISGDTIVVGAVEEDSNAIGVNGIQNNDPNTLNSGAAYVFVRNGGVWSQQAYLKASNTGAGDNFGTSVALSGDTIVVGAVGEDSNATGVDGNQADNTADSAGAAYVFVRNAGNWFLQAYLKASNTEAEDLFGRSVAIAGDTIVVGAVGEDSNATGVDGNQADNNAGKSGAAYVFVRNGAVWNQQAYLKASNTEAGDNFGELVALSGDTIVVGAVGEDSNVTGINGNQADNTANSAGAAYVFVRNGVTWSQQAYLKASNTEAEDLFGQSVAISGDTIVVGASREDSAATGVNGNQADNTVSGAGAAYVFVRNGVTWNQQGYLKASHVDINDLFGNSVAISGDTIVVGVYLEDSNATGIGGDPSNNAVFSSGAGYVFVRNGVTWTQQAYLKASNTETDDFFGTSVAISGNTIVVGAVGEDSAAIGVDGNQNNNNTLQSGAAYVFQNSPLVGVPPPTVKAKGKKAFKTSKARVTLRGTSTHATQVLYKATNKRFKPTKGSPLSWKTPSLPLKPGRNIVKVQGIGPGGVSSILKFVITYTAP